MNRSVTVLCLLLAMLTACTGAPDTPEPSASPSSVGSTPGPAVATPGETATPAEATTPSEAATGPAAVLGPEWVVDRDGDTVPDAVEAEVGTDPAVDECAERSDCGRGGTGPNPLTAAERGANTLLILDASGSMAAAAGGGGTKMRAAKRAITRYVVGLPDFVQAGLMVYGHVGSNDERDKDRSCEGIETFAPLGDLTHKSVDDVLDRFEPVGWTPVAGALDAAREEFEGHSDADNRVILVSDGIETCDGDPVAAARRLAAADVSVTVDVVGFDVDAAAARQLEKVADVTGGTYTDAPSAAQLTDYFNRQVEQLFALRDQITCVARHRNQVTSCYHGARNQARDALFRLAQATGDATREDALLALAAEIEDDTGALVDSVNQVSGARIEELDEQFRAARERWQRRYRDSAMRTSATPCAGPFEPLAVRWS